jgi:hypothetical protein
MQKLFVIFGNTTFIIGGQSNFECILVKILVNSLHHRVAEPRKSPSLPHFSAKTLLKHYVNLCKVVDLYLLYNFYFRRIWSCIFKNLKFGSLNMWLANWNRHSARRESGNAPPSVMHIPPSCRGPDHEGVVGPCATHFAPLPDDQILQGDHALPRAVCSHACRRDPPHPVGRPPARPRCRRVSLSHTSKPSWRRLGVPLRTPPPINRHRSPSACVNSSAACHGNVTVELPPLLTPTAAWYP